jgi:hypothetical protein
MSTENIQTGGVTPGSASAEPGANAPAFQTAAPAAPGVPEGFAQVVVPAVKPVQEATPMEIATGVAENERRLASEQASAVEPEVAALAQAAGQVQEALAEQAAPADDQHVEAQPWPGLPDHEPSRTVRQDHAVYQPDRKPGPFVPESEFLILPADTRTRREAYDEQRPNEELGNTEQEVSWIEKLETGEMTRPYKGSFESSVEREGGQWAQQVGSETGPLSAARPRLAQQGDSVLTGARAVQRIRNVLGLGSLIQVPLWHSGFWVTLRAPTEGALLDFHRRTADTKVSLGRQTYGLAFSNSASYLANELLTFVMDHLHDATLKAGVEIRKFIKVQDLQTLAWGMACVIWPKGFQYSRSALVGENQEKKEFKGLLNLTKLQFVDNSKLTPWQITHMSRRLGNNMTVEMLERYQSEFTLTERKVTLEPGLSMMLKIPTVDEYITSGQRWVSGIEEMVNRSFQQPPSDEVRDRYVTHYGKASVMRQFGHWVKFLAEDDTDPVAVYQDPDTLDMLLSELSQVDSVRKAYFDAIHQFTDDTIVSVIATPTVDKSEEERLPRFPHLVPIDALYSFFILLVQKSQRIAARDL